MAAGGFVDPPPSTSFTLRNESAEPARILVLRKRYQAVPGLALPGPCISGREVVPVTNHTGMGGCGVQVPLLDGDMRFDFEVP